MVGVGVYFSRSRCKGTDSIQEVADIPFADNKQSLHYWLIPADSAALTPEPRPMENDLRHSLLRGRGGWGVKLGNSGTGHPGSDQASFCFGQ
jgi:hypothetical protein